METRKLGKITLTLIRIDPHNGTRLWEGHNGQHYVQYIQYAGTPQLHKAAFVPV